MNQMTHRLCTHAGPVFAVLLGIGIFGVAGWLPPHSPAWSADEIVRIYAEDRTRIRIGMTILALGSVLYWPFAAAISAQMRRIEGRHSVLATTQLAVATGTVIAVLIPAYVWLAVAFRPGAPDPATVQALHDFAWLMFVGLYPPAVVQNVALATCILLDRRPDPIYPRWVGYLGYWLALCYFVGALVPFFHRGPFAWNGVFGFWVAATTFFAWVLLMWWATLRAIRRQADAGDVD